MPETGETPNVTPQPEPAGPALAIHARRSGGHVVTHQGLSVGFYQDGTLTLNLGWCHLAGLSLTVQDDPSVDNHRGGIALERLVHHTAGAKST